MSTFLDKLPTVWGSFVSDIVSASTREYTATAGPISWTKSDGSLVTDLDLRLDTAIRICVAGYFPDLAVLSEEIGLLVPKDGSDESLAIVDPVDGTDSLIQGRHTWWVSVGLVERAEPVAGLIHQPATGRLHHTAAPSRTDCERFVVGMSPDRLRSAETAELRSRLNRAGAELVGTPHAVEKVAAVLEGRSAASMYLPSAKSPTWHSWDLAAAFAVANANGLVLRTTAGDRPRFDHTSSERSEAWICARDEKIWHTVRDELGYP